MKLSCILCVKHLKVVLCTDNMFSLTSLIFLSCSILLTYGVPTKSAENLLDQIKLDEYPMAKCNDGSTAVYYRKPLNNDQDNKKLLIYLKGGGFCVPFVPGIFVTWTICSFNALILKVSVAMRGVLILMILYLSALQQQIPILTKTPGTVTPSSVKTLLRIQLSLTTILVESTLGHALS